MASASATDGANSKLPFECVDGFLTRPTGQPRHAINQDDNSIETIIAPKSGGFTYVRKMVKRMQNRLVCAVDGLAIHPIRFVVVPVFPGCHVAFIRGTGEFATLPTSGLDVRHSA